MRRRDRRALLVAGLLVVSGCSTRLEATLTTNSPPPTDTGGPSTPPCTVSPLLVPSCGAWLGTSVPSLDGTFDHETGLAEYIAATGHDPDIVHLYERGDTGFPTAEQIRLIERDSGSDRLFYFSWKPSVDLTWREVADGGADATIDAVAERLIEFGEPMFLTVFHEPENDVVATPGSGMTTADYVDMYRHVVLRLRDAGVRNAVFVMTYMGFDRWATMVDELYPGDDVIDWIGYDPYGRLTDDAFGDFINRPDGDAWPGFYSWATTKAPGTPIMLAEWGFDLARHDESPDLLADAVDTLRSDYPEIAALVYWNGLGERVDARLSPDNPVAGRFADAYREFASDAYFAQPDLDALP